jgi:polyisoprenoid-binding protein YceI
MMLRPVPFLKRRMSPITLTALLGIILAACSPAATETPAATPALPTPSAATATPSAATGGALHLVLSPGGNEARYRVREQLASLQFPSDAVGATQDITGEIVLNPDGTIVREASKFVVDLRSLRSDSGMRDGYIQRSTLETSRFPTAEFVPTEMVGLPSTLPTSGEVTFQLTGDLTVHGVTRPSTWEVKAQVVDGRELVGSATTNFTFSDFGMSVPNVARVLSIEETIRLEYDFHLVVAS